METPSESLLNYDLIQLNGKRIGIISFNDPGRANAMTEAMSVDFFDLVEDIRGDLPDALVLTGEGRHFSAGGDMDMIQKKQGQQPGLNAVEMNGFYRRFLGILELGIPVVSAVNGAAIGAGLGLACAADHVMLAEGVNKLRFSFVDMALMPGMGCTAFPGRRIGDDVAGEMLKTGDNINAQGAFDLGMADELVPLNGLVWGAVCKAAELVGTDLDRIDQNELDGILAGEAEAQGASFCTEEHRRKFEAFLDRTGITLE